MGLATIIEGKNSSDFAKAFGKLMEACNHCHREAGVGFVVMRVPTFSNQLFPPEQK